MIDQIDAVADRLAGSKAETIAVGHHEGTEWAKTIARYTELENLGRWHRQNLDFGLWAANHVPQSSLSEQVALIALGEGADEAEIETFWQEAVGDESFRFVNNVPFQKGFIEGAVSVWDEFRKNRK